MSDTQLPAVIDTQTGEVVPVAEAEIIRKDGFIESILAPLYGGSNMPVHLATLSGLADNPEMLELVMSLYHQEPLPFGKVTNMTLPVYGMLVYEHGPYKGMDEQIHSGYYQVLFLVEIEEKMKVVKSSSPGLLELATSIIRHRGGGLFEKPIEYLFSIGDDKRHRVYNKSLDLKRLKGKKA